MIYIKDKIILIVFSILVFSTVIVGQTRSTINKGVDKYEKEDYKGAAESFKKSINEKFENFKGHFNLGDALYKQGQYEDALSSYKNALTLAETDEQKAEVYHNIGNTLLKSKKLKEAIGAYTESLKLNPNDLDCKYNLSYALRQMKQQQKSKDKNKDKNKKDKKDDKKKNKDNKKNDKDKKKDKNKKDDDKKDKKNKDDKKKDKNDQKDKQNKDQNKKDDKKKDKQNKQSKQQQQPPPEISKEEAKRILNALKDDEAKLQKELRKKKGKRIKVEKDW